MSAAMSDKVFKMGFFGLVLAQDPQQKGNAKYKKSQNRDTIYATKRVYILYRYHPLNNPLSVYIFCGNSKPCNTKCWQEKHEYDIRKARKHQYCRAMWKKLSSRGLRTRSGFCQVQSQLMKLLSLRTKCKQTCYTHQKVHFGNFQLPTASDCARIRTTAILGDNICEASILSVLFHIQINFHQNFCGIGMPPKPRRASKNKVPINRGTSASANYVFQSQTMCSFFEIGFEAWNNTCTWLFVAFLPDKYIKVASSTSVPENFC